MTKKKQPSENYRNSAEHQLNSDREAKLILNLLVKQIGPKEKTLKSLRSSTMK